MHRTLSILLILVPVVGLSAQLPGPVKRLPMPGGVPGLDRIIDNPPLTTTTADAWLEAPPLDGYAPRAFQSMKRLPRGKDGRFVLRPGAFALEAQSYCLHIATRGPVEGDGYLNAPLKGSRAEVVRSILRNAEQHPGILQQDIQMLLWSLLARLEVDDLDPKLKATAAQLLSPKDLKSVSDSPWDLLDTPAGRQAVGKLPQPVRRALNAEGATTSTRSSSASRCARCRPFPASRSAGRFQRAGGCTIRTASSSGTCPRDTREHGSKSWSPTSTSTRAIGWDASRR
jgi:hypothetical protein